MMKRILSPASLQCRAALAAALVLVFVTASPLMARMVEVQWSPEDEQADIRTRDDARAAESIGVGELELLGHGAAGGDSRHRDRLAVYQRQGLRRCRGHDEQEAQQDYGAREAPTGRQGAEGRDQFKHGVPRLGRAHENRR